MKKEMDVMYRKINMKILMTVLAGLMVIIIFGGIYAVLTHRITFINSTRHNFRVRFDNLRNVSLDGTAKEITKPTINTYDTRISNYSVSLTSPGDSVSYVFDVVNDGDYHTIISAINLPIPMCKEINGSVNDNTNHVCQNLVYTLKYIDGQNVRIGDKLLRNQRKTMILNLYYKKDINPKDLAKNDLIISNLDVDIFYTQCVKNSC